MQSLRLLVLMVGLASSSACGGRAAGTASADSEGDGKGGSGASSSSGTGSSSSVAGGGLGGALGGTSAQSEGGGFAGEPTLGGSAGQNASGSHGGTPPNPVCGDFMSLWKVRQSEREPGEPIPPEMGNAPCFDCIAQKASQCGALSVVGCASAEACLERHCLCTPDQPVQLTCAASDYPNDLCTCADSCFSGADTCATAWADYMQCITDRCSQACGL